MAELTDDTPRSARRSASATPPRRVPCRAEESLKIEVGDMSTVWSGYACL